MFGLSQDNWTALALVLLAAVLSAAGFILSGLLSVLVYFAKSFFDYASAQLSQLPVIKEELVEQRYARQGDRKDIDHAHKRLDEHQGRLDGHDKKFEAIEDTEIYGQ